MRKINKTKAIIGQGLRGREIKRRNYKRKGNTIRGCGRDIGGREIR